MAQFPWSTGPDVDDKTEMKRFLDDVVQALKLLQTYGTQRVIIAGSGSPEGAVAAEVGSIFQRSDGGSVTSFYVKESGSGSTGWTAK